METIRKTDVRTGLFDDRNSAEAAYKATLNRGYRPEDVSIFMTEDSRKKYYDSPLVTEEGDKSMEGLAIGGAVGGTVLGTIGAVIALSSTIVIPGLGLVLAGPLAAGLVGVGAGSIAGGVLGALIGAGIPEERAKIYEQGLKNGGIVLSVPVKKDRDEVLIEDWKASRGRDIV